jgi:metallo-beta-lactamase class B
MKLESSGFVAAMLFVCLASVRAQMPNHETKSKAASPATDYQAWREPVEPFHVVGPIYYVGTKGLGVYLIKTSAGLILLNGALPGSTAMIKSSIRKLGFKTTDIHLLLISHAHQDHVGTLADFKKMTGASVEVLDEEVELLNSGGKADYLYSKRPKLYFQGVMADKVLKDGQVVTLGDVSMTARFTPGHTKGTTTWVMTVEDEGRKYLLVFPDGTGINPGTRLVRDPLYPGIAEDYKRTIRVLESLNPDIFLAYHAEFFDLAGKRARMKKEGVQAWVDPQGYKKQIAVQKVNLERQLAQEGAK